MSSPPYTNVKPTIDDFLANVPVLGTTAWRTNGEVFLCLRKHNIV